MIAGWLLAVDPSVRSPGAALFYAGELRACARILVKSDAERAERSRVVVEAIRQWAIGAVHAVHSGHPPITAVITEWPQWYAVGKSKVNPNDLACLAGIGGALATAYPGATVSSPTPREWIDGLPKATRGDPWATPRGVRIKSRLAPAELALVPAQHDAIDGCGLGLWLLGRLQLRRVLAGTT